MREVKCLYIEDYLREDLNLSKKKTAILDLSTLQSFIDDKSNKLNEKIDLKQLQNKNILNKKYSKLKILGKGDLKNKIEISTNFISKEAKAKIEKIGGKLNILKN